MRTSTRLLGVLSAAALIAMGLLQLRLADLYPDRGEHPISLDDQRIALAGVATAAALALLLRPRPLVWTLTLLATAAIVGYLVYGTNRCWPLSDYDGCFNDDWDVKEVQRAIAAGGAALLLQCFGWVSAVSAAASRDLPSHDALQ